MDPKTVRTQLIQVSASRSVALTDMNSMLYSNAANERVITIDVISNIQQGDRFQVLRLGTGDVNVVAGTGITLLPSNDVLITGQYDFAEFLYLGSDTWLVTGQWSIGAAIPQAAFLTQWLSGPQQSQAVSVDIDDQSGNNNDGTEFDVAGITYQNNSYYLNAFNSGILGGIITPPASYTALVRFRRATTLNWIDNNNYIFGSQNNNTNCYLRYTGGQFVIVQGGTTFNTGVSFPALAVGQVLDIAVVYDSGTQTIRLYLAGVPVYTGTSCPAIPVGDNWAWGVHGFNNGWFQEIVETALWTDVALTQTEMDQMRATFNKINTTKAIKVVVDGDSNTAVVGSWYTEMNTELAAYGYYQKMGSNNATGGSTWDTLAGRGATVDAQATGGKNVLLVMCGTNDLNIDGLTAAAAAAKAQAYVTARRAAGVWSQIVLMQIPALRFDLTGAAQVVPYNAALAGVGDLLILQDVVMSDASNLTYFTPDGIHLDPGTTRTPIAANNAATLVPTWV